MKNTDIPAAPFCSGSESSVCNGITYTEHYIETSGLTKREIFAMHAMQALATNTGYDKWELLAGDAVDIADALLKELEK